MAANLGDDLLGVVAGKMNNGLDYTAFRSVCTTFRAAAPPRKLPPLLMFPYDRNDHSVAFFDPCSGDIRTVSAPECKDTVLCGASHGWMVRMDASARVFLFNPFTRARIDLPRGTAELAQASGFPVTMTGDEVLMRDQDGQLIPLALAFMKIIFIHEAVLSAPPGAEADECVVLAILSASQKVAYSRAGDACWTIAETGLRSHVRSAAYCHWRFYVADDQGVAVLDVAAAAKATATARVVGQHILPYLQGYFDNFRLLEWEGELFLLSPVLMVIQLEGNWHDHGNDLAWQHEGQPMEEDGEEEGEGQDEEDGGGGGGEEEQVPSDDEELDEQKNLGVVERFNMLRLDAASAGTWSKVHSVGGNTIFWSQHHCWTMIRSNLQGCRVDSVYGSTFNPGIPEPPQVLMNDDDDEQHEYYCIRVVSMADGRTERVSCNFIARDPTNSIAWFQPRL